ncbi:hypothetical protein PVAP13_2KG298306 [Panicum virgatum]|uniref:Uncharacterized protein n=1 Tax=Panicum virgatum TaxID=38727 RepID=A0A8T0W4T6_PANVG|nr:hypothetical protein PVAP13_2KG298306 [Panicum virgatum]
MRLSAREGARAAWPSRPQGRGAPAGHGPRPRRLWELTPPGPNPGRAAQGREAAVAAATAAGEGGRSGRGGRGRMRRRRRLGAREDAAAAARGEGAPPLGARPRTGRAPRGARPPLRWRELVLLLRAPLVDLLHTPPRRRASSSSSVAPAVGARVEAGGARVEGGSVGRSSVEAAGGRSSSGRSHQRLEWGRDEGESGREGETRERVEGKERRGDEEGGGTAKAREAPPLLLLASSVK